jgi:hypothetical protein
MLEGNSKEWIGGRQTMKAQPIKKTAAQQPAA